MHPVVENGINSEGMLGSHRFILTKITHCLETTRSTSRGSRRKVAFSRLRRIKDRYDVNTNDHNNNFNQKDNGRESRLCNS